MISVPDSTSLPRDHLLNKQQCIRSSPTHTWGSNTSHPSPWAHLRRWLLPTFTHKSGLFWKWHLTPEDGLKNSFRSFSLLWMCNPSSLIKVWWPRQLIFLCPVLQALKYTFKYTLFTRTLCVISHRRPKNKVLSRCFLPSYRRTQDRNRV